MQGIQGITGIRGIGYRRRRGGGVTPGPSWPSAPVAGLHVYSEAGPAWCRQFSDGTGSVVANDPVGYLHNAGTLETPLTQETTGARPLMTRDEEREAWYLQPDGVDDWLEIGGLSYAEPYDVWICCTSPSADQRGVVGFVDGDGNGNRHGIRAWTGDDRAYEVGDDNSLVYANWASSPNVKIYRLLLQDSQMFYYHHNNADSSTTSGGLTSPAKTKNRIAIGRFSFSSSYGDPRIYAIAATLGSVMSTDQVNALKADWSAKFGVEFAW